MLVDLLSPSLSSWQELGFFSQQPPTEKASRVSLCFLVVGKDEIGVL